MKRALVLLIACQPPLPHEPPRPPRVSVVEVETTPPRPSVRRRDFVVGHDRHPLLDELDRILLTRLDLHARENARVTTWTLDAQLVAARVELESPLWVVRHEGRFYDQDGFAFEGKILVRPLPISRLTSRFGRRLHPLANRRSFHRGVDYGAPEGTPLFAPGDALVRVARRRRLAGNYLVLDLADGWSVKMLHLSAFNTRAGAQVAQGDVVGFVGSTGLSTGPHLHYEMRRHGTLFDPTKTLPLPTRALGPLGRRALREKIRSFNRAEP